MSDIFISYARKDQQAARKLAKALESQGWSVWWDPKLHAGEHFDDVIEQALSEARCVIVLWSKRSVQSRYVKDEAAYALLRNKLVTVAIDEVELPFRYEGIHTPRLSDWDGSEDAPVFTGLVDDIVAKIGQPSAPRKAKTTRAEAKRKGDEERRKAEAEAKRKAEEERRQAEAEAKRKADEERRKAEEEAKQQVAKATLKRAVTVSSQKAEMEPFSVFRDTLKDGSYGPEMIVIPEGAFRMGDIHGNGSDAEKPVHTVRIARPFALGKHVVTFREYNRFAKATDRKLSYEQVIGSAQRPVNNVSWDDAVAYTEWLSEQTSKLYRLPTEAEWEYAARAGTTTVYWWGSDIRQDGKAWAICDGCGSGLRFLTKKGTAPVGSFAPNPWGLFDTAGNVWEWVEDCYHKNYDGAPEDGSAWESEDDCSRRTIRGGSWFNLPHFVRSAGRYWSKPVTRNNLIGFRIAQDI